MGNAQLELIRERKARYNVTLLPSVVEQMDYLADTLNVSRSELIVFCYKYTLQHCFNSMLSELPVSEGVAVYE